MRKKEIVFGSILISESQNREKIVKIVNAGETVKNTALINVSPLQTRESTQIAFAGAPEAISEALFRVAEAANSNLKLAEKSPRSGIIESVLFIPVQNISLADCKLLAKRFVRRIYQELKLPVFYHNYKSYPLYRDYVGLVFDRGIHGLMERMDEGLIKPTVGSELIDPHRGVIFIAARPPVIRYIINISTFDPDVSYRLSQRFDSFSHAKIWSANTEIKGGKGQSFLIPEKFKGIKGFGVPNDYLKNQQLSLVIYDTDSVGLHHLFETAKYEVEDFNAEVFSSEILGFIHRKPLIEAGKFYADKEMDDKDYIRLAVEKLKLDKTHVFVPEAKIIECLVESRCK